MKNKEIQQDSIAIDMVNVINDVIKVQYDNPTREQAYELTITFLMRLSRAGGKPMSEEDITDIAHMLDDAFNIFSKYESRKLPW